MPPHCFTTNWMFNFLIMIVEDSYMRYLPRPSMCQKWHMQLLLLCRHRRHITYRSCAWYGHFVCRRSCLVVRVTAASMVVRRLDCRMIGPTKMVQHMTPMRGSLHLLACTSFTALLSHNIFLPHNSFIHYIDSDPSFLSHPTAPWLRFVWEAPSPTASSRDLVRLNLAISSFPNTFVML
jgi:hypothetical protein